MPTTTDARCNGGGNVAAEGCSGTLPTSPFYAPRYHFGMLLGVDDFETEQAYHRGKTRLHNAWLHGEGVVWGFRVDAPARDGGGLRGELRVAAGLALDGAGRELHLDGAACMSVPAWYAAHRDDPDFRDAFRVAADGTVEFDGYVTACFRACLARPVPAIAEPCAGAAGDTAYSRARETVELRLVPGPLPARTNPYPRLRLLFGLAEPAAGGGGAPTADEQEVLDARAAVLALDPEARPAAWLEAFRRFAALDGMERAPAETFDGGAAPLFPEPDDRCVVLASVAVTLRRDGGSFTLERAEVDNTVRRSHVATSTLQELLCGPPCGAPAAAGEEVPEDPEEPAAPEGSDGEDPEEEEPVVEAPVRLPSAEVAAEGAESAPDAGGPRIDPGSVTLEGEAVTLTATRRISKASVGESSFSVTAFDNRDGWHPVRIRRASVDRTGKRIRLDLGTTFGGNLVRIIARGTGPTPLLGSNGVPLAGAVGGPPGGTHDGRDFVLMLKRSET